MTVEEIKAFVEGTLSSFENDNADTPYQEGYRDAFKEMLKVITSE